jgi:rare lipoprotein A
VRNLANQQEVVVRITDRCPNAKDRIIDLSEAAAEAIGFKEDGLTQVELEVLDFPAGNPGEAAAVLTADESSKDSSEEPVWKHADPTIKTTLSRAAKHRAVRSRGKARSLAPAGGEP